MAHVGGNENVLIEGYWEFCIASIIHVYFDGINLVKSKIFQTPRFVARQWGVWDGRLITQFIIHDPECDGNKKRVHEGGETWMSESYGGVWL
jgi:hypothetical protein